MNGFSGGNYEVPLVQEDSELHVTVATDLTYDSIPACRVCGKRTVCMCREDCFRGIQVFVDRPRGFIQEGEGADGPWMRIYDTDYGFIPRTEGGDDEDLDVFLGPNPGSDLVVWCIQQTDCGEFDEYKVMLGFSCVEEAVATYARHIPMKYLHDVVPGTIGQIQALLGLQPEESVSPVPLLEAPMQVQTKADPPVPSTDNPADASATGAAAAAAEMQAAADAAAADPAPAPSATAEAPESKVNVDILNVAAEHLAAIAKIVSKAKGRIEAGTLADLKGMLAMLSLIPGVADVAKSASGPLDELSLVGDITSMFGKARAEQDPIRKAAWFEAIRKALDVSGIAFESLTAPAVTKVPEQMVPTAPQAAPARTEPATGIAFNSTEVAKSIREANEKLLKTLAAVSPKIVAKAAAATPAPAAAPALIEKNVLDPWPEGYVDTLPDSAFLFVENVVPALKASGLPYRHFAVKNHAGELSRWHILKALELLPATGFSQDLKVSIAQKAKSLLGQADEVAKSAGDAKTRGDDGWAPDLADPRFMKNGKVEKIPGPFGFDNIHGKIRNAK